MKTIENATEPKERRKVARNKRKLFKTAAYPKAPSDMVADWLAAGNKIKVGPVRYAVPSQQGCK